MEPISAGLREALRKVLHWMGHGLSKDSLSIFRSWTERAQQPNFSQKIRLEIPQTKRTANPVRIREKSRDVSLVPKWGNCQVLREWLYPASEDSSECYQKSLESRIRNYAESNFLWSKSIGPPWWSVIYAPTRVSITLRNWYLLILREVQSKEGKIRRNKQVSRSLLSNEKRNIFYQVPSWKRTQQTCPFEWNGLNSSVYSELKKIESRSMLSMNL